MKIINSAIGVSYRDLFKEKRQLKVAGFKLSLIEMGAWQSIEGRRLKIRRKMHSISYLYTIMCDPHFNTSPESAIDWIYYTYSWWEVDLKTRAADLLILTAHNFSFTPAVSVDGLARRIFSVNDLLPALSRVYIYSYIYIYIIYSVCTIRRPSFI